MAESARQNERYQLLCGSYHKVFAFKKAHIFFFPFSMAALLKKESSLPEATFGMQISS